MLRRRAKKNDYKKRVFTINDVLCLKYFEANSVECGINVLKFVTKLSMNVLKTKDISKVLKLYKWVKFNYYLFKRKSINCVDTMSLSVKNPLCGGDIFIVYGHQMPPRLKWYIG